MNLSIGRVFDLGQIQQAFATAGVKGSDDFLTYMQEFCNQIITAMRGRLTLEENSNSQVKLLGLKHNVPMTFALGQTDVKKMPKHIIPTRTTNFDYPLTGFVWRMTEQGLVEVKAKFDGAPTVEIGVQLVLLF